MRKKLIGTYLAVLILPVLLINLYLFRVAMPAVQRQAEQINMAALQQTSTNIASKLNELFSLSSVMSMDISLIIELGTQTISEAKYVNYYTQLRPMLFHYRNILPSAVLFYVVSHNENLYYEAAVTHYHSTNVLIKLTDEIAEAEWYKKTMEAQGRVVVTCGTGSLIIAQWMNARLPQKDANISYIELPEFEIRSIYRYDADAQEKQYYLVDENMRVLSSTENEAIGQRIDGAIENGPNVLRCEVPLQYINQNMTLLCVVPDPYISRQISDLQRMAVIYTVLSLIVGIGFIVIISGTMTYRIRRLNASMQLFTEGGTPPEAAKAKWFPDEIDDLSARFDEMTREIHRLIEEVYTVEVDRANMALAVREARLQALQSQINPHFLFNFMDNVRTGLLRAGERDTAEIIQKFTMLLRRNIDFSQTKPLSPIREEIDFVRMYLSLQQYRYRDRLTFDIEVEDNCLLYSAPRFLFQPLVENAIVHGLEGVIRPCHIGISVRESGDQIIIVITDNGIGMDEKALNEVRRMLSDRQFAPEKYIGLRNVRDRLELMGQYQSENMAIESESGRGTTVTIHLLKVIGEG